MCSSCTVESARCAAPHQPRAKSGAVLVLGGDMRMVLAIARSLGRRGLRVHVGWCEDGDPALYSRYVTRAHHLPPYVRGDNAWKVALGRLMESEDFDLVVPATESAAFVLQRHQSELAHKDRILLLSDHAFQVVYDKLRTYRLAESLGVPVPSTRLLQGDTVPEDLLGELSFPVMVKPCSSVRDADQIDKHFVAKVRAAEELQAYVRYLSRQGAQILLQEHVEGTGVGVEVLADGGEILVAFQHERIHETTGHGGTYRKSTAVQADLLRAASKLIQALDYTGVAMIEFRVQRDTGAWRLLEINGRFWGSLPLAVAAGADFPYYPYQLLVEGERRFPRHFRLGVRSRSLSNDLRWFWRWLRGKGRDFREEKESSLGWSVNEASRLDVARELIRALTLRDHVDTFARDDPKPMLIEIHQLGKALLSRFRLRGRKTNDVPAEGALTQKAIDSGS